MDRSDIRDAIQLFEDSQTARKGSRAPAVVRRLWRLFQRNEIGFHNMRRITLRGEWLGGRRGHDLRLNRHYFERLPLAPRLGAISLVLVHEGVHATDDFDMLYSELAARILPVHYYRELAGTGVFNEANDPPRPGKPSGLIRVTPEMFPEFKAQSEALRKEQLIDYILANDTYTDDDYIDEDWIIDKLDLWGGLKNRWPSTKALYIKILAKARDPYYAGPIVAILESIETRKEWDTVLGEAGRRRTLRLALDDLSARSAFSGRIAKLEQRWGSSLTEDPPPPPRR